VVKELNIRNFKSIKDLQLDCKRVNLFIGEPNVGKSNILEALGLFALRNCQEINRLIRFNDLSNIFFDNDPSLSVTVSSGDESIEVRYNFGGETVSIHSPGANFMYTINGAFVHASTTGGSTLEGNVFPYYFKPDIKFTNKKFEFLSPPNGDNLFTLLQTNRNLRNIVSDFIQDRGFKLTLRQGTSEIEISKEVDNILTIYPYQVISDTLQRILFYVAAIESTESKSTLVFEEPESNIFPYYTKYLAEKIAYSEDKQYFITTHNPYFLQSLLQKTPLGDLQVNLVYMKDFQTRIRPITVKEEVEELIDLESNVFLNLDKFLSE